MTHVHDFKFVKRYYVGGRTMRERVYWILSRCACGKERREKV